MTAIKLLPASPLSVSVYLSCARSTNFPSRSQPQPVNLDWRNVIELTEKSQQNCETKWERWDRLRSKYLAESALAAPFQPASVSGSGDQAAGEKPTSYLITSPTNHKTK